MSGIQSQNQLVTVTEDNESQTPEQMMLPEFPEIRKNFMADKEVTDWVMSNVVNIMESVRSDYQPVHSEWEKINNMLSLEMENDAKYKGETQVYLPTFAKSIETRAAHVCKALFPTDSYMDALSLKVETPEEESAREATKAWMKKQIEENAKFRFNMKAFVRNALAFGVGVLKEYWEDEIVKQSKRKHASRNPTIDSIMGGKKAKYCGKLRCKTINNFAFYAYPLSVDTLDQCTLIFEDIQVSKQFVDTMIKKGYWKQETVTMAASNWSSESSRQTNLLKNTQTSQTAISGSVAGDLGSYSEISECWFSMHLPESYFTAEEKAEGDHLDPVPMKAIVCSNVIVDIQYNPFNHGRHPYLMKKLMEVPDVLMTPGYGKMVMSSQYLVNDLVNQVNDNGIYALNPVTKRIVTEMAAHSLGQKISPGANFDVLTKDAISWDRPPIEQIQYGIQLLQLAKSEVSDPIAPPSLQGSGSGGGGMSKTATGAQLLQANTGIGVADFNEDMEQTVCIPFMQMAQQLGQQFESEEMFFAITGKEKVKFTPEMLAVECSWQWVASSQTINQQTRSQQMGMFLQAILAEPVQMMLQQKGITLNIEPILRKMWEDGLGQRSFESIATKAAPGMGMGGMPGAPAMPGMPGAPSPLSPEQISSVSQNPSASAMPPVSPAPGEGEQFRAVRDEAEGISGSMGGMGNMPK